MKRSPRRVLRGEESRKLPMAEFRSFEKRPVNYYRHIFADEGHEAPPQVDEHAFNARMEEMLAAERSRATQNVSAELQAKFAAGLQKGREESAAEVKRGLELLEEYARVLQAEKKELSGRAEQSAVELAFALAKRIIDIELEAHPEAVAGVVRKALQQVLDCDEIRMRVNPEDLDYLRGMQESLQADLGRRAQLDITSDTRVERGGCVIETEKGFLDARIASQLETLRAGTSKDAAPTTT